MATPFRDPAVNNGAEALTRRGRQVFVVDGANSTNSATHRVIIEAAIASRPDVVSRCNYPMNAKSVRGFDHHHVPLLRLRGGVHLNRVAIVYRWIHAASRSLEPN